MRYPHALDPAAHPRVEATLQSRPARFLREVASDWSRADGTHLAAALAFYSVLSLAPFLLVVVAIAGWLLGSETATRALLDQIADVAGAQTAKFVGGLVSGTHPAAQQEGARALIGLAVTLAGATATFAELQHGLDRVFGERVHGTLGIVRTRLIAFGLVVAVAFLSMASLALSAGVHSMLSSVAHADMWRAALGAVANEVVSFAVLALAFFAILRVLPERAPRRRAAWIGAASAAGLFVVGKFAIAWYLAHFALASAYGAAGAVVVVMLWIYWSSALFFVGAVVAHVVEGRPAVTDPAELAPVGIA
jgi:membrane protein